MACGRFVIGLVAAMAVSACGAAKVEQSALLEDTATDLIGREWTLDLPMHFSKMVPVHSPNYLMSPKLDPNVAHSSHTQVTATYGNYDCPALKFLNEPSVFGQGISAHGQPCMISGQTQLTPISVYLEQNMMPAPVAAALAQKKPGGRYRLEVRADFATNLSYSPHYWQPNIVIRTGGPTAVSEPRQTAGVSREAWFDSSALAEMDGVTMEQIKHAKLEIRSYDVDGFHLRRVRWVIYSLD